MAVVRARFIKSGGLAKANIRYIQHRPGKEGEKTTRELFTFDRNLTRQEAYEMIDSAHRDTYFYRISLNPDPKQEDHGRDLDLKQLTRETMRALEEYLGKSIEFVAAIHADHIERRHAHLLALLPRNMNKQDLTFFIHTLTNEAKSQRRELDRQPDLTLSREKEQEQEKIQENKTQERKQGLELELAPIESRFDRENSGLELKR